MKKQMIKRADGSYSQRGLWDNIRANRGSGKKPTAEMLKQERKIKAKMADGGVNNPGFKALPGYVQAKIRANMQEGGFMPQSSAGQSVLQEAMAMSKMEDGGKMPASIARARFMAAANGNVAKAKETASKYGYKMQAGGMNLLGVPNMNAGTAGFDFAKASAYATAPKEEVPTDVERMQTVDIRKKRSFWDRVKGNIRKAGRSVGLGSPIPKTEAQQGLSDVLAEVKARENAIVAAGTPATTAEKSRTAFNKIKSGDVSMQNIGDYMEGFGTYLNLNSDRNAITDLFDMASSGANAVGAESIAGGINNAKQASQSVMQSGLGQAVDFINPLSIGANLVSGTANAVGEISAGNYQEGLAAAGKTAALVALRGKAGNVAKGAVGKTASAIGKTKVGTAVGNVVGSAAGSTVGHQLQHAGQHYLLSPLMAHKNGGTIKDMYYMKKGGQFPDRYKKMGFSGVDKPKRTTTGPKSHAVVTKVNGNYKLIRFGQQGVSGSPDGSARNKAFKARHAKNIAKGKSSAAYWANKIKW